MKQQKHNCKCILPSNIVVKDLVLNFKATENSIKSQITIDHLGNRIMADLTMQTWDAKSGSHWV